MTEGTYRIAESVVQDTLGFRKEVEKYLAGETSAVAFRGIRVPMGIYEQRENDTFMVRVRGAAGVFLPHQVRRIADLSERHGNGIIHVTTRQDLQIHQVRIADTPAILEKLLEVGLSSRGGGGNTVRNISACPLAGICREEPFDVTPHALALTEYLIRERGSFNLPRKFKVAFSGCGLDCGLASVADLGFFAHEREGVWGFAVYAGGGMGAVSALGIQIEEFIPQGVIFEVAEAVKRLFDKHGDRANRRRARLRFVVQRAGPDEFRRLYREELEQVQREGIQIPELPTSAQTAPREGAKVTCSGTDLAYTEWLKAGTIAQRQDGLFTVQTRLPLGDIPASVLRKLSTIALAAGDRTLRATQEQDLQLRGVCGSKLWDVFVALRESADRLFASGSVRCVACAGASTCKLGLCLSRGLATAVEDELKDVRLPFGPVVHISGCPNSCGHHPIAPLGLHGGASRVNGRLVPYYSVVAGGRLSEGSSALAQPIAKIPAKAVPAFLHAFWVAAASALQEGETLSDLMSRWGIGRLKELATGYECVPSYEEAPDYYRDFGCAADFSLAGRGPGECGAGVTDVVALDIDEAKRALREDRLYDAIVAATRALLVTKGLEPKKDREVFAAFSDHLIAPGWVSRKAQGLLDAATDLKMGDRDSLDDLREPIKALVKRIEELLLSLDSNLNFRVEPIDEASTSDSPGEAVAELDLRGVLCPMSFVRAKLQLEQVDVGDVLEVLLDEGEPARNVPASFAEQGQEVLSVDPEGSHYRVRVRRTE